MYAKISSVFFLLVCTFAYSNSPIVHSWYTEQNAKYARIYETTEDETQKNAVTTWSRGQGTQSQPTYSGIHEVSYSEDWVYIRTTGLGHHIMGPWYLNTAKTNLFPSYPANQAVLYRFPKTPTIPNSKSLTKLGAIGYFVDGVAMFDSRDAFSYSNANSRDATPNTSFRGDGIWNRDAWVNEGKTFDAGNAHQAGSRYHYHANPPGLRFLLKDHVDYDPETNTYTEIPDVQGHSPILGWVGDGFPLYGPYAFSDPQNADSVVRRMISGFQKRDGSNGSTDLANTGRTSLPLWAATVQNKSQALSSTEYGPDVSTQIILGHYIEDYAYKGDLGMDVGVDFDLDIHNGRFCVTPEFPEGTYAYFVSIEEDGTPAYPYNIGRQYYGQPTGENVSTIQEEVTKFFEGGPEIVEYPKSLSVDKESGDVVLIWDGLEGGEYQIETSSDLKTWIVQEATITAESHQPISVDAGLAKSENSQFYRVKRLGFSNFDDRGFEYEKSTNENDLTSIVAVVSADRPPPPLDVVPVSVTFNGIEAVFVSRPSENQVELKVDLFNLPDGDYDVTVTYSGPAGTHTGTYTLTGNNESILNNVLLLIVDDWGIDRSPLDNQDPNAVLPKMPTLQSLAQSGVRFTKAYAQPLCSPTRATILTGRHPFRHGVGSPVKASNALKEEELTLPDILTEQNSRYAHASFGKWHLGGGNSGPSTTGGWRQFKGIQGGGVSNFSLWNKLEIVNGTVSTIEEYDTYTTTDQVNDAVAWIDAQGIKPWFCWMGFNAAHSPFHTPPADLAPEGGYSSNSGNASENYINMLEALDTEIKRLLESVDLERTNVILIGDNGTPSRIAQSPFNNEHSKGTIYEGGSHVPLVISGPSVMGTNGSTSDRFVHCVDLFSTILELCGIDPIASTSSVDKIDSRSLCPILKGAEDPTERIVVVEKFGESEGDGRALISETHPDYKLIVFGDPKSIEDTPRFEFFNITDDPNEETPLNTESLSVAQQIAYDYLIAKEKAIGGRYSDPPGPIGVDETIYLKIADGDNKVPPLTATKGETTGQPVHPFLILVGGKEVQFDDGVLENGNPASRVDENGQSARGSIKCTVNAEALGLSSGSHQVVVSFPPQNDPRVFTATTQYIVP